MKRAFALVVLVAAPTMVFAQGTVIFNNDQTGPVRQWTSFTDSTLLPTPVGGGHVELLTAPYGTAFTPLLTMCRVGNFLNFWSLADFLAANPGWAAIATTAIEAAAGSFNGGTVTLQSTIAGGATAEYVIIGWTGTYSTLDEAIAAIFGGGGPNLMFGSSPIFTTATGSPQSTPPTTATLLSDTFNGMTLAPLPITGDFGGFKVQPTNETVVLGATATFYAEADACPAPYYQWYFNGVSIPGATGKSLQIWYAQLTNAGTYYVVVNGHPSQSATLTVLAQPPSITSAPQSQTAYVGSTVDFRVSAAGSPPLAYRWFFNTTNVVSGDTSHVLRLTSVQPAQAGAYTVVVSNVAGAVTSTPALLGVIPPVGRRLVPGLSLLGQPGSILNLEDASTLGPSPAWMALDSVMLTHTSQWYFDVSTPLPPQRFYRAWQTGGLGVIPTLDLKMVPALTLTGSVGSSVRLDYINQFGPIDAWVALDTEMLTNTSRLYFDVAAPGQPPRLYRLVQVP